MRISILISNSDKADIFHTLLDYGADVNTRNKSNNTVLMFTAKKGYHDKVLALLEHGADANIKDTNGRTALDHALSHHEQDIVSTLCAWPTVLDKIGCSKEDETIVEEDV